MSLIRNILGELFDTWLMYCEDCKKEFKAKRGSLIGSDRQTVYTNCTCCGGNNTRKIRDILGNYIIQNEAVATGD